jgi:hypothetical protein
MLHLVKLIGKLYIRNVNLKVHLIRYFATVHFYNQSKEKGIKATGIGIE